MGRRDEGTGEDAGSTGRREEGSKSRMLDVKTGRGRGQRDGGDEGCAEVRKVSPLSRYVDGSSLLSRVEIGC